MNDIMDKIDTAQKNWSIAKQNWLKEMLHSGVVTVIFTKKDGTERTMKCTLNSELLPPSNKPFVEVNESTETKTVRATPIDSLAVFDVEAKSWRSFRYDSVKSFSIGLE